MPITQSPLPGFGIAITFQSGFFAFITAVNPSGMSRASLDTSHNAISDGYMTFTPSKLSDAGGLDIEFFFKSDIAPPIDQAAESITVTWPKPSGAVTAGTWVASGFMTDFSVNAPHDGIMTGNATLKFSGKPTVTASS